MHWLSSLTFAGFVHAACTSAQTLAVPQSTGFNSSFTLSSAQIELGNLSDAQVHSIETVINFDRSQLTNGGPHHDDFYTLPPLSNDTSLQPGIVLKVQDFTDTSPYAVPPNTALSRILYTTTNLNGTVIPASAFILWPFAPKQLRNTSGLGSHAPPVVLWTHGTSSVFASASPSSHRALWYGDAAPFSLALAGYAVVAPDYAGLGIANSWDGSTIPHQYLASPASAHDALYSLEASLTAFPGLLRRDFVAMGHSQGGGVAWGVAELLASEEDKFPALSKSYRGTIAGSPTTGTFTGLPQFILTFVGIGLNHLFTDFRLEEWLTPLGVARAQLFVELEGGIGVAQQLFLTTGEDVVRDSYTDTWYVDAYRKLADAGRKDFKGPMLVLQGTEDVYVGHRVTTSTVRDTCNLDPQKNLEYHVVQGVGHVPVLDATRQIWLQWIEDRLNGKRLTQEGCVNTTQQSFLPIERYLAAGNSFPQWAGASIYTYETPLGP